MRTIQILPVLALLSACAIGSQTETTTTVTYDKLGRVCDIKEKCRKTYFLRADDGTKVKAKVNAGVGSVTIEVEGEGAQKCTPTRDGVLQEVKDALDECECPPEEAEGDAGVEGGEQDRNEPELTGGELFPACEGETRSEDTVVIEECEVELNSSDWECEKVEIVPAAPATP